jgi:Brp/Blh family beta-carotene 15,15'-monooxygenase
MNIYSNIAIVASFLGLWIDSFFNHKSQIFVGFLLIFTFGILHGANDLQLIDKIDVLKDKKNSTLRILIYYIMFVLIGILSFYIFPLVALLLFIVVSAYHFGEQQWQKLPNDLPMFTLILYRFLYGFVILFLLFVFHTIQVQNIISTITTFKIPVGYFWETLKASGIAFIFINCFLYWKILQIRKKLLLEFFYLIVFAIIFKSSSLIWGFAIYFVVWHSIPSIIDQIKFLNGSVSKKHFLSYCKAAGVYWFVSILGIAFIYLVFKDEQLFNAVFFSFLAAITFPHVLVITKMFQKKTV